MEIISKRAELKLKQLIDCENFIKNKKIGKFYSKKDVRLWLFGKKEIGFPFEQAFCVEKGNPLAHSKHEINQSIKSIRNCSIFDMFKKSCEYHASNHEKKDIDDLQFKTSWNEWIKKQKKLKGLHIGEGLWYEEYIKIENGRQQYHQNFIYKSFSFLFKMDVDIINELYSSQILKSYETKEMLPNNGKYLLDSINYSHIFIEKQEFGDEEPQSLRLTLKPDVINYFKDKHRGYKKWLIPVIISGISALAALIIGIIGLIKR